MEDLLLVLTICTAAGAALIGGVFFAFSVFIMRALANLPSGHGIAAMQSVNVSVINPLFLGPLFGTGALCVVLIALSLAGAGGPDAGYRLVAGVLYLAGTLGVTIVCNVPMNNKLARLEPSTADAAQAWKEYVTGWTAWNHVRTAAAVAGAVLLMIALA